MSDYADQTVTFYAKWATSIELCQRRSGAHCGAPINSARNICCSVCCMKKVGSLIALYQISNISIGRLNLLLIQGPSCTQRPRSIRLPHTASVCTDPWLPRSAEREFGQSGSGPPPPPPHMNGPRCERDWMGPPRGAPGPWDAPPPPFDDRRYDRPPPFGWPPPFDGPPFGGRPHHDRPPLSGLLSSGRRPLSVGSTMTGRQWAAPAAAAARRRRRAGSARPSGAARPRRQWRSRRRPPVCRHPHQQQLATCPASVIPEHAPATAWFATTGKAQWLTSDSSLRSVTLLQRRAARPSAAWRRRTTGAATAAGPGTRRRASGAGRRPRRRTPACSPSTRGAPPRCPRVPQSMGRRCLFGSIRCVGLQ